MSGKFCYTLWLGASMSPFCLSEAMRGSHPILLKKKNYFGLDPDILRSVNIESS